MLKLLVLVTLLSLCAGEEEAQETARAAKHILLQNDHVQDEAHRLQKVLHQTRELYEHHDRRNYRNRDRDGHSHEAHENEDHGPLILRTIKHHYDGHGPDIARQNKIIEHVYSPDYAEPTWVLDYRYLKSGGRDYTRGPGGQILILPKGIRTKEHKEFKNYDELIEHLRLKSIEQRNRPKYIVPLGDGVEGQNDQQRGDDHEERLHRRDRHNDDEWWKEH